MCLEKGAVFVVLLDRDQCSQRFAVSFDDDRLRAPAADAEPVKYFRHDGPEIGDGDGSLKHGR